MRTLTIGNSLIADSEPCYVIAEIGHNHGGNVATACDMIRIAKACGTDAVKLQKRENATLKARLEPPRITITDEDRARYRADERHAFKLRVLATMGIIAGIGFCLGVLGGGARPGGIPSRRIHFLSGTSRP